MKTKPYTKNKKTIKKPDLAEGQWTPGEYKDEMQLDRIEQKLDKLLARPVLSLVPWSQPPMPSPWYNNPNEPRPPVDHYGNPVIYCTSNGGTR